MAKKKAETETDKKHPFLEAFLFTENGRPKSSLGIYTFCLSIVYLAVYALCFEGAIRLLTSPLSGLSPFWSNLIISLTASLLGTALCTLPHRFFRDKRLVFRTYWWLAAYAVLVLVTMAFILSFGEGFLSFLTVFAWFAALPVGIGLLTSWVLYRRDDHPASSAGDDEPEWKKYVRNTR